MTITTEELKACAESLGLNFFIEERSGVQVKQWFGDNEGCIPATDAEVAMWQLLAELKSYRAIASEYKDLMHHMDEGGDFYEFQDLMHHIDEGGDVLVVLSELDAAQQRGDA